MFDLEQFKHFEALSELVQQGFSLEGRQVQQAYLVIFNPEVRESDLEVVAMQDAEESVLGPTLHHLQKHTDELELFVYLISLLLAPLNASYLPGQGSHLVYQSQVAPQQLVVFLHQPALSRTLKSKLIIEGEGPAAVERSAYSHDLNIPGSRRSAA
jgi:hypothetical protein